MGCVSSRGSTATGEPDGSGHAAAFCAAAGHPQHARAFVRAGYDDQVTLAHLTERDLDTISTFSADGGVVLPGHRKRLLLASAQLREELATSGGTGALAASASVGAASTEDPGLPRVESRPGSMMCGRPGGGGGGGEVVGEEAAEAARRGEEVSSDVDDDEEEEGEDDTAQARARAAFASPSPKRKRRGDPEDSSDDSDDGDDVGRVDTARAAGARGRDSPKKIHFRIRTAGEASPVSSGSGSVGSIPALMVPPLVAPPSPEHPGAPSRTQLPGATPLSPVKPTPQPVERTPQPVKPTPQPAAPNPHRGKHSRDSTPRRTATAREDDDDPSGARPFSDIATWSIAAPPPGGVAAAPAVPAWKDSPPPPSLSQRQRAHRPKLSRAPGPISPGAGVAATDPTRSSLEALPSRIGTPAGNSHGRADSGARSEQAPETPAEVLRWHATANHARGSPLSTRGTPVSTRRIVLDDDPRVRAAARRAAEDELRRVAEVVRTAVAAVRGATSHRTDTVDGPASSSGHLAATRQHAYAGVATHQREGIGAASPSARERVAAVEDDVRARVARLRGEVSSRSTPMPEQTSAGRTISDRTPPSAPRRLTVYTPGSTPGSGAIPGSTPGSASPGAEEVGRRSQQAFGHRAVAGSVVSRALALSRAAAGGGPREVVARVVGTPERCAALTVVGADVERRLREATAPRSR